MAKARATNRQKRGASKVAEGYVHPDQALLMRPEVGTQPSFRKKKPPVTYRYDSSLSPALDWDGDHGARELGEWLVAVIEQTARLPAPHTLPAAAEFKVADGHVVASVRSLQEAVDQLKRLSKPFLDWTGKAERLSFDVPTLPLFVHERLSTQAIVQTLVGHKSDKQKDFWELLGDPRHSITDQVLKAYEYPDKWVNRLILGDSLVVMNSLLHYERLGGQVQMIYIDPPYGVKFGSNFQPFVRKRNVAHNDDADFTREPEMVKAYRDTWELGLHSYLTYMRDRLLLARELLTPSGSVFVQISDENLHHVRELTEEVFGAENLVVTVVVKKKGTQKSSLLDPINDYILWATKDKEAARRRFSRLFTKIPLDADTLSTFRWVELPDGREVSLAALSEETGRDYRLNVRQLFKDYSGARLFTSENLTSGGVRRNQSVVFSYEGRSFDPGIDRGNCWKHTARTDNDTPSGMDRLATANRLFIGDEQLRFKRYLDDFGFRSLTNVWDDVAGASEPLYVVQTTPEVVRRCVLMTTSPGDLVLDPTCGSGTTAYVAEQTGRRWITVDTSRVPLALTRQRLLTATYPWHVLQDASHGPGGGFVYSEEGGGIVKHLTSSTIANDKLPSDEVIVSNPDQDRRLVRVTGPFVVEATIPTPVDWEGDGVDDSGTESVESYGSFVERMIEVLRRSPILHLKGGKTVELGNIRPPAKSLSLSAEGLLVSDEPKRVAFVFGPENGAVSEKLIHSALQEAQLKGYAHLYVIGFAIQPHARELVEKSVDMGLVPATYVQATPDLLMGDLLKHMRSSQIFSVCGLPDVKIHAATPAAAGGPPRFEVELTGLDTFDPTTMAPEHLRGDDVPCWMLDTDYNDLCFRASQVFFPRTAAWDSLRKALKSDYDDTVWEHLAGARSAPFEAGDERQVAVKVIDDRGNELLVVKPLS